MANVDDDKENQKISGPADSVASNEGNSSVSGQVATVVLEGDQVIYEKRVVRLRNEDNQEIEELLKITTNLFARHKLDTAADMLRHLSIDQRTPHIYLTKTLLILLNDMPMILSDDLSLVNDLFDSLHLYDINKKEVMLELLQILIANKDPIGAKKMIESNEWLFNRHTIRKDPIIDTYLDAYVCLLDYMQWKGRSGHSILSEHSDRLFADKTKLSLKNIICDNKDIILDNFVGILIEMYEYDQQLSDAMEVLTDYVTNNPNHFNAYIYLYKFCVKYPNQSDPDLKVNALKNIANFSPDNRLVLDLVREDRVSNVEKFKILMEFIDHKPNREDIEVWNLFQQFLLSIEQKDDLTAIKNLWTEFYEYYWLRVHCNLKRIKPKDFNPDMIKVIECKQKAIQFFYSSSHPFIIETNRMIENYRKF